MIKKVINLANKLDNAGLHREAGAVDGLLEELSRLLNEDIDLDLDDNEGNDYSPEDDGSDDQIKVGDYTTKNFEICPGALSAFNRLLEQSLEGEDLELASNMAKDVDKLFSIEKSAIESGSASDEDLDDVVSLARSISYDAGALSYILSEDIGKDFEFLDAHVNKVVELTQN